MLINMFNPTSYICTKFGDLKNESRNAKIGHLI